MPEARVDLGPLAFVAGTFLRVRATCTVSVFTFLIFLFRNILKD